MHKTKAAYDFSYSWIAGKRKEPGMIGTQQDMMLQEIDPLNPLNENKWNIPEIM